LFRGPPAILFWAGVILLSANVVGLFTSLRNPAVYTEHTPGRRPALITEEEFYRRIDSYDGDRRAYVTTVTRAVGDALAHYWEDAGIERFHLRIPFYENYLLFLASYIYPAQYQKYEFMDYRKAVERGVGLCSECAVIEVEILKRKGIRARIVSLRQHVVVEGEVDPVNHEWWMLDPDFGVTIPHDLTAIRADPALIRPYYIAEGRDEKTVSMLKPIFGRPPSTVFEGNGAAPYAPKKTIVEQLSYIFIWVIPVVLMLPALIRAFRRPHPHGPPA
jgi:hypothetical protein